MSRPNLKQPHVDVPDGLSYVPRFGHVAPADFRYSGVPSFDEANEVLPESQWVEHDHLDSYWPVIEAQQNNNCTNAALACGAKAAFDAAGVEGVPRFSWAFNYSLRNGGRDAGAMCRDLAIDSKEVGLAPSKLVPDERIYKPRGGWSQDVLAAAATWKFLEVYQCMNFQHIASAISQGFIVYHGFCLGRSGLNASKDGKVPEYDGSLANGHAMCSRGLTRRFGGWRAVTPNTWGQNYGLHGVGFWPPSYFWEERGNFVNLDAYALRAVKRPDALPVAG